MNLRTSYTEMSAGFSEMNLCAIGLDSESPPDLYTTHQPHLSKNLDFEFLESLQEIPLEELLAESEASECPEDDLAVRMQAGLTAVDGKLTGSTAPECLEDDLAVRKQGGLTAVDNELLSALMEIRNHSTDIQDSDCALNPPEMMKEQIIPSIEKEDDEYHEIKITSDNEIDRETTAEPEITNIDSVSSGEPSTAVPCLPLPRYRSMTPGYEILPSPSTHLIIRSRPVRHRRPATMDPFRHNRKKLDANLRMAILLRRDPKKYFQVLEKREGIAPRMCRHRMDIRNKVNKRGLEYETGFMRWRVHWRSRLAVGVRWLKVEDEGIPTEIMRRTFYVGKAMELDGWAWAREGDEGVSDKGVRTCGWEECGAGLCGWRGMANFLPTADYGDDEEEE